MKLLEVRDGFVKFENDDQLSVSSFVEINDVEKSYIAQVVQIARLESKFIMYAKFVFCYDGSITSYDGSSPSLKSDIKVFDYELINKMLETTDSIFIGKFQDKKTDVELQKSCFDKQLLISVDSSININKLVASFKNQFENLIIIDTLGVVDSQKYEAVKDFKIPLNTSSLQFLYEDCLKDATSDSKSLIKDIFKDLAEYSRSVPFLPFETLKSIIVDMVEKQHIFKLLVLKNKLMKFDASGYFAKTKKEVDLLDNILNLQNSVIDLSKLEVAFQNRYLYNIYEAIDGLKNKPQVLLIASNLLDKKSLKKCLTSDIATTLMVNSRFKYINEMKSMFSNFIIEPNFKNNEIFKTYSKFLNINLKDICLVVGDSTKNLPILTFIEEYESNNITINEEKVFEDLENSLNFDVEKDSSVLAIDKKSEELIDKVAKEVATEKLSSDIDLFVEDSEFENNMSNSQESNIDVLAPELYVIPESNAEISSDKENLEELIVTENDLVETSENIIDDNADELIVAEKDSLEFNLEESEINNEASEHIALENYDNEYHTQIDEIQMIEVPEAISDLAEEAENVDLDENKIEDVLSKQVDDEDVIEVAIDESFDLSDLDSVEEVSPLENVEEVVEVQDLTESEGELEDLSETSNEYDNLIPEVIPISEEEELAEFEELDSSEILDTDILVEFDDKNYETDDLDKEIVEDVDKVFTTMKDNDISDSDLDFIDELNNNLNDETDTLNQGFEELPELYEKENEEESFIEPLEEVNDINFEESDDIEILETRKSSTPMVPVYDAEIPQEDVVVSDALEQGDIVVHAKYGNGVVEKMIKYGAKSLYSINFDNVGRRLLDPTLTEIKKA